jgi:hypothetical protein
MKKTILSLILIISALVTNAHTPVGLCWDNGKYFFTATQVPSGVATIKVYSNSGYTGTPIETKTITVVGTTANYFVNQPVRTTKVYVKVTWSDAFVNQNPTGTNQCVVQAIITLEILSAKNIGDNTVVDFRAESTTANEQITLNFTLPNGDVKHYCFFILEILKPTDVWEVVVSNKTSQILTVKKL